MVTVSPCKTVVSFKFKIHNVLERTDQLEPYTDRNVAEIIHNI